MKIRSWGYNIGQGFKNIFRNRMFSLASIATMTTCLFLFGMFWAIMENFQYIVQQTEESICITVFFDDGLSKSQIDKIGEQIKTRSEVYYITYTSADEAWEQYKQEHFQGYEDLVEGFADDNPLANSSSYSIFLNDISQQDSLVAYLNTISGIRTVNSSKAAAQNLEQISDAVSIISGSIILLLSFVAMFLISNTVTIGVTVRRQEIAIMKLIGATDIFVKAPFMVEGIVIGLVGSIIPLGLLYGVYDYALEYILEKNSIIMGSVKLVGINEIFSFLIPVIIIAGVLIGGVVSYCTISKHVKV